MLGRGTRSHMLQLRVHMQLKTPYATTKEKKEFYMLKIRPSTAKEKKQKAASFISCSSQTQQPTLPSDAILHPEELKWSNHGAWKRPLRVADKDKLLTPQAK